MFEITPAISSDFDLIWPIFRDIVAGGDTYVYAPDITKEEAKIVWFDPKFHTFIAFESETSRQPAASGGVSSEERSDGRETIKKIVGAYVIRPNHRDLGNHIANAAYIVAPNARGKGIGKKLALDSLAQAKKAGYKGIQFNFVVSTNDVAISLWKSVGFEIIGTVPNAYRHQQLNKLVPIHIMYRDL